MSPAGRRFAATATALTLLAATPLSMEPRAEPMSAARAAAAQRADQIRQREWHLEAMRIPRAWRTSKGKGVTIAVLDTGVDGRHPDLTGQVIKGPDLTGGSRKPGGRFWGLHGTSMASIIAGHGHGAGRNQGVMGVAPRSRVLSIRVTWENNDPQRRSGGRARNRDAVAQGIRYAVNHGADIINMSLGGGRLYYEGNSTEESAIRYALSKGVVLIASAGNDGNGANRNNYPAAYDGVIAAGALDRRLGLWKNSNRRPYVAVCAPGVEIVSADADGGYVIGTGTSPSSALVAGVAALVRSRYPGLTPEQVRDVLVRAVRQRRATPNGTCPGPLDAVRALEVAKAVDQAAPPDPALIERGPTGAPEEPYLPSEPEEESNLLLGVLGGGAVLVVAGLLLGWRQRRGPGDEDDDVEADELYEDGPYRPRPQPSGPAMAPVNAPMWQSTDALGGDPAGATISDLPRTPAPPWPPVPSELRPYLPEKHGQPVNGNGSSPVNGHDPAGDEFDGFDDEAWERFRRNALAPMDGEQGAPEPPPEHPPRPDEDDDFRSPWW